MKKLFSVLIVVAAVFALCSLTTKNDIKVKKEATVLTVYYFHTTNRCPTCLAIEKGTQKTIEKYFANELKSGKIKFDVINVDEAKNKAISEKHQAFGIKLLLYKNIKGKETKEDMTGFGFSNARGNYPEFEKGLKDKITALLK